MPAADKQLQDWLAKRLSELMDVPADHLGDIVENIITYDSPQELKEFLSSFTEKNQEYKVHNLVEDLFERYGVRGVDMSDRRGPQASRTPSPDADAYPSSSGGKASGRGGRGGGGRGGGQGVAQASRSPSPEEGDDPYSKTQGRGGGRGGGGRGGRGAGGASGRGQRDQPKAKEKQPFDLSYMARDANDKRNMVIDAASGKYEILTNCLNCGKVITKEEGWGPCLFCGNPLEISDGLGQRHGDDRGYLETVGEENVEERQFRESFEKAKATKDRLLNYDRDAKKRTKVYDDSSDFYEQTNNAWLSSAQREEAAKLQKEQEEAEKNAKRMLNVKIDFFGRTVVSNDAEVHGKRKDADKVKYEKWHEDISDKNKLLSMMMEENKSIGGSDKMSKDSQSLYNKLRASLHSVGKDLQKNASKFDGGREKDDNDGPKQKKGTRYGAVESDRFEGEFSEVSTGIFAKAAEGSLKMLPVDESPYGDLDDAGMCLSMHQPMASLLIHGFKRAEGRGWKTEHRGRLWIHAAGRVPEDDEILEKEARYRSLYEDCGVAVPPMPSECGGYPTSALLGCVDVEECWSQEEYQQCLQDNASMPKEMNDCEFIFWCLRPRKLVVPLKMGGDHKIWPIQGKSSLQSAQRALQPVRWPVPADGEIALAVPRLSEAAQARAADSRKQQALTKGHLDIWPTEAPEEALQVVEKDKDVLDRDAVVLQDGFVHLIGFVPPDVQQRIVDEMRELGVSELGFAKEQYDGIKNSSGISRMYLGNHWNSVAQRWEKTRSNLDGKYVREVPKFLLDLYADAVKRSNRELKASKKKAPLLSEGRPPSIGVVNFYPPTASMQIHQDKTESKEAIDGGFPVLGICIGDSCDFEYSSEQPSGKQKPKVLSLKSGDVYVFGGASRHLWHGVSKIKPRTAPPQLRLLPGRLNVTLRAH